METNAILAWTLVSECPIPPDVSNILVPGEIAVAAYKTFRDSAVFTNKRLIVRDAQGITGKKVEIYSLPYSSIYMWSSENGHGLFNFNSEIELWTKAGHIKVNLNKGLDVRRLDNLIAQAVLGSAATPAADTRPTIPGNPPPLP
ncbi:PH domain-containing protein [Stenotrophomonas humi]|uniref:PH domain-containing protein n=1 Tax=Stenotrophomonas humi TaxID=405444 RepID=UPI0009FB4120|nr:PH domain-containing protein [Stenotrophomonas humi]